MRMTSGVLVVPLFGLMFLSCLPAHAKRLSPEQEAYLQDIKDEHKRENGKIVLNESEASDVWDRALLFLQLQTDPRTVKEKAHKLTGSLRVYRGSHNVIVYSVSRKKRGDLIEITPKCRGNSLFPMPRNSRIFWAYLKTGQLPYPELLDPPGAKLAAAGSAGSEASAKPAKGDLFSAIEDGDYDQAAQLISGDADLEAKDEDGNSPLHIAADRGRGRIAKLLVDKGADVNARNSEGITPLHEAAAMGDFQTASLLVEAGADVKAKSDFGATPLHFAAEMRNFEIAQIIRSMGMSSTYNWKEDNLEVAELLIRNGGDPNAQDNIGSTPLQRTTPWNYLPMAKLLIESGADPMLPDGNGLTPLDHAKDKGARDVAKYLKKVQKSKK